MPFVAHAMAAGLYTNPSTGKRNIIVAGLQIMRAPMLECFFYSHLLLISAGNTVKAAMYNLDDGGWTPIPDLPTTGLPGATVLDIRFILFCNAPDQKTVKR